MNALRQKAKKKMVSKLVATSAGQATIVKLLGEEGASVVEALRSAATKGDSSATRIADSFCPSPVACVPAPVSVIIFACAKFVHVRLFTCHSGQQGASEASED